MPSHSPAGRPRVYWLLRGSFEVASSRIHGHRVHRELLRAGWDSTLLVEPLHWLSDVPLTVDDLREVSLLRPGDIVVFQKLEGPATRALLDELAARGVHTVFIDSDLPMKLPEARRATCVVCSSQFLAEAYRTEGVEQTCCIPDAFEYTAPPEKRPHGEGPLKCVWFGVINAASKKWRAIEMIHSILQHPRAVGWELVTVTRTERADVQWDLETAWQQIRRGDVVVLPSLCEPWEKAKSSNRAIQAMAMGLPVVASPVPAYEEVITDGVNGYLCRTEEEWLQALERLRDDATRHAVAARGYEHALRHFSIERIGKRWMALFEGLTAGRPVEEPRPFEERRRRRLRARVYGRLASGSGAVSPGLSAVYLARAFRACPWEPFTYRMLLRKGVTALRMVLPGQ